MTSSTAASAVTLSCQVAQAQQIPLGPDEVLDGLDSLLRSLEGDTEAAGKSAPLDDLDLLTDSPPAGSPQRELSRIKITRDWLMPSRARLAAVLSRHWLPSLQP